MDTLLSMRPPAEDLFSHITGAGSMSQSHTAAVGGPAAAQPTAAVANAADVFEARRQKVVVARQGTVNAGPANQWQAVEINLRIRKSAHITVVVP